MPDVQSTNQEDQDGFSVFDDIPDFDEMTEPEPSEPLPLPDGF